jgi:hypothetical protein
MLQFRHSKQADARPLAPPDSSLHLHQTALLYSVHLNQHRALPATASESPFSLTIGVSDFKRVVGWFVLKHQKSKTMPQYETEFLSELSADWFIVDPLITACVSSSHRIRSSSSASCLSQSR